MNKIALIGTSEQQNPLIVKAKELGYETHAFAWQTGGEIGEISSDFFYPISAGNKEEILKKCKELGINAIVSVGSDIAACTVAYVAEAMGLPSNSYESLRIATNKLRTRKKLGEYGILQPRYAEVGDTIPTEALNSLTYPLIVKPSDRSGGRGIRLVESESELFGAINLARETSFERKAIVEEYVNGQLYSCECISFCGKHRLIGFTKRDIINIGGRICEHRHTQPALLPLSVEEKMSEIYERILDALGLQAGASSIEFIVGEDLSPYIVEVTPTMYGDYIGTHLVPNTYGFDYTKAVIEIACGKKPDVSLKTPKARTSVSFIYSSADGSNEAPAVPDGNRYGHFISVQTYREFGGCAPLRVAQKEPFFCESEHVLAMNSEYTAFYCALKHIGARRVHIPYYAASAWGKIADELGVECKHYHINENFVPVDLCPGDDDAVLLINYHGLCTGYINNASLKNKIIDNSMAFYQAPLMEKGVYNIYSCRKFFPVPDGAYLISSSLDGYDFALESDVSYKRALASVKSLELGEGAAYKEQQTVEQELAKDRKSMSSLTKKLLCSFDYTVEKALRQNNFNILHSSLKKYNLLDLDQEDLPAPQYYPLLVNADIRELLIGRKIYIPLMWRKTATPEFEGKAEKMLSDKLICLPLSVEYSHTDMEYLAETVISLIT